MKKTILPAVAVFSCLLAICPLSSCSSSADLTFFNWGEYIDNSLITRFEKENNCRVSYDSTFDSNEKMLVKLESTSFDIVVPSDYAIEELASKNKIQTLDMTKFSSYSTDKLVPSFKTQLDDLKADKGTKAGFDLLKYAVPYTMGEIGLIYDSAKISEEEIKQEGWEAVRTAKNKDGSDRKVCIYDASRDIYSMALSAVGYDFVDPTDNEIAKATEWLKGMKSAIPQGNLSFLTEEILTEMPKHSFDVCLDYSGDALYSIMNEEGDNKTLNFIVPDPVNATAPARTNVFTDALCITNSCTGSHLDLAYKFIDFLCQEDVAAQNTEYIGYTTPIKSAYDAVLGTGGCYADYQVAYGLDIQSKDHFYRYNEALKNNLEDLWNREIRAQ
jgi:spermidine/putrescine-binding protein